MELNKKKTEKGETYGWMKDMLLTSFKASKWGLLQTEPQWHPYTGWEARHAGRIELMFGFPALAAPQETRAGRFGAKGLGGFAEFAKLQSEVNWVLGRMDEVGDQSLLWRSFRICCL